MPKGLAIGGGGMLLVLLIGALLGVDPRKLNQLVGDDRLQTRATGFTSPENYTHGTSAQRVKWFRLGLGTGDLRELKTVFEMRYEDL